MYMQHCEVFLYVYVGVTCIHFIRVLSPSVHVIRYTSTLCSVNMFFCMVLMMGGSRWVVSAHLSINMLGCCGDAAKQISTLTADIIQCETIHGFYICIWTCACKDVIVHVCAMYIYCTCSLTV